MVSLLNFPQSVNHPVQRPTLHFCLASPCPRHTHDSLLFRIEPVCLEWTGKPCSSLTLLWPTGHLLSRWDPSILLPQGFAPPNFFCLNYSPCKQLYDWLVLSCAWHSSFRCYLVHGTSGTHWLKKIHSKICYKVSILSVLNNHETGLVFLPQKSSSFGPHMLVSSGATNRARGKTTSPCSHLPCRIFLAHSLLLSFSGSICLCPQMSPLLVPSYYPNLHLTPKWQFINPQWRSLTVPVYSLPKGKSIWVMKFKVRSLLRKQGIKAKTQSILPFHRDILHDPREYQNALVRWHSICI